ncbi:unnamed protein product [Thelazia callipaeda]|uniref:Fanconi anemia group D2 protein n=1 Tax=Thelazia callipaeda TaxID=103827 RepID=A0A0N5CKP5_THECL|nr:unnamed protein product [Thelazia callipaeda]
MYRRKKGQSSSVSLDESRGSVPETPPHENSQYRTSSKKMDSSEDDSLLIDEEEFRQALDRCYTQTQNTNVCKLHMRKLPPRSEFEELLERMGVEVRLDDNDELSIYLSIISFPFLSWNLFEEVVQFNALKKIAQKRTKFFDLFEGEVAEDFKLKMYLSPCATESGYVDTFVRALLVSKATQAVSFETVIRRIETYAKCNVGDGGKNDHFALACIAQFRYLDIIYDCKRVFNSVFDCDLENWRPTPRDALIQALPEILPSPAVQQDTANNLLEMFQRKVTQNSVTYRIAILQTLLLFRIDEYKTISMRGTMLQNVMELELEVLPELVSYCMNSIQRNEKFAFRNIICSLRTHLQLEDLQKSVTNSSKKTIGKVITETFEIILKKVKTGDGRYLKDALNVLITEGQQHTEGENEQNNVVPLMGDCVPATKKEFVLFDILLSFTLMDVNNWSRTIHGIFKQQISLSHHCYLERLISSVFNFTEYTTRFFQPIRDFCETLMWSFFPSYVKFGAYIYKTLFLKLPSQQSVIFDSILHHMNGTEQETTEILLILQDISENHNDTLAAYSHILKQKLSCLINFSFDNVCRFFTILLSVERISEQSQVTERHKGLNLEIERMISSSSTREKVWGILGVLMQIQQYLMNKRLSIKGREDMIKQKLTLLDERTKSSVYLRTFFYEHFARILNDSKGIECNSVLTVWADRLSLEFRQNFMKQFERSPPSCRLEDERYCNSLHKEWFCLSELVEKSAKIKSVLDNRVFIPIAHFQLLLALTKLKYSWTETQHISSFHEELYFVLEANISMIAVNLETQDKQCMIMNCNIYFFCIQWIRLILNTFATRDSKLHKVDEEAFHDLMRKKFALMIECQKSLVYTIKKVQEFKMPWQAFEQVELIVFYDVPKKSNVKTRKRKRSSKNESANDEEGGASAKESKGNIEGKLDEESKIELFKKPQLRNSDRQKVIDLCSLASYFTPLKFAALLPKKRKQTIFLLETLDKLLEKLLPKRNKKSHGFLAVQKNTGEKVLDGGNSKMVWHLIYSVIPTLFTILNGSVDYFKSFLDTSSVIDRSSHLYYDDMSALMYSSLLLFHRIFSSSDFMKLNTNNSVEEEGLQSSRARRRKAVMEKLEKIMIQVGAVVDSDGIVDTEFVVADFFISIAETVPTVNSAVALLQLLSCDFVLTPQKSKVAKIALSYLKKEWFGMEEKVLKGAMLNRAVSSILRLYLSFRKQNERLSAIQWMLANKVSELVPEEERRRSKISSLEPCYDQDLDENEGSSFFACFSKSTFSSVYKVLFSSLNETIKIVLPLQAVESGTLEYNECFALWKIAASTFCLLTLLIRVKELRNASVLLTAAREGRLFLQNFVVKSSFIYLLADESRFAKYGTGANALLKTIQIGNRSLQNMSAHAKSTKCGSLLKLLPQLRATSEQFIRAVHKLMIGIDCDSAFQIGLLKSRNLDGEELKAVEIEDYVAEDAQQEAMNDGDNEETGSAEELSDISMNSNDESPVF